MYLRNTVIAYLSFVLEKRHFPNSSEVMQMIICQLRRMILKYQQCYILIKTSVKVEK